MDTSTSRKQIDILVADDHPVMRGGICATIDAEPDMRVVGEARDGREAVEQYRLLRPDIAVVDLQMPNADGFSAIQAIRTEFPSARIVVLTSYPGDARVKKALALGATSYLLKTATREEILDAIRAAFVGRRIVAAELAAELATHIDGDQLTSRELRVLRLIAAGLTNRQIAERLSISEETVKTRVKSLLMKLAAVDRTHAVAVGIRRGFIEA